jgi:hypothetical protein
MTSPFAALQESGPGASATRGDVAVTSAVESGAVMLTHLAAPLSSFVCQLTDLNFRLQSIEQCWF